MSGKSYLTAGDWAPGEQVIPLNPSYFAPYAYRVFAEADPGHDWGPTLAAAMPAARALLG